MDDTFKIRDRRGDNRYFIDNAFLKTWGARLGPHCIAVYNVLVMCANADDQTAYPSFKTIADLTGMSRRQVVREIEKLKANNIIKAERRPVKHSESGKEYYLSDLFTLLHPDEWVKIEGCLHEPSDSQSLPQDTQSPGVVTGSPYPSDTQSSPLVTQSPLNNNHPNNTQLPITSPIGEGGKPPTSPVKKPEPIPKIEYTEFEYSFLTYFSAKRFKNPTQHKTIAGLIALHGESEIDNLAQWAAKRGMGLGQAIPAIESALKNPKRKDRQNGVNQNGQHSKQPTEKPDLTNPDTWAAQLEAASGKRTS